MAEDLSAVSLNLWINKTGSVDAIYDGHPLLRKLRGTPDTRGIQKSRKIWREESGGEYIQGSPRIAQGVSSTKIRGLEQVDATPHMPTKKARWEWAMYGAIVSIPLYDELRNQGPSQMVNDWQDRVTEQMDHMKADIETDFGSANSTGNSGWIGINGLDSTINETATSPTTLGGLTRSTYTGWQNQSTNINDSVANGVGKMAAMRATISSVTGHTVDLMLCPAAVWGFLHGFLQSKGEVQFTTSDQPDFGFPVFRHLGAEVCASQHIKAQSLYFLTTQSLWFCVHKRANFKLLPIQEGARTFGKTRKMVFMGNWASDRWNANGVCYNITS